jgi:hypothetical protein
LDGIKEFLVPKSFPFGLKDTLDILIACGIGFDQKESSKNPTLAS